MRLVRAFSAAIFMLALFAGAALAGIPVGQADLQVTKTDTPDPVAAGATITYTITVQNLGPDPTELNWSDAPPIGTTTFVSLIAPAGWTATTPPVGGAGSVVANHAGLTVADGAQVFTLVVRVDPAVADGTVLSNFTSVISASSNDPVLTNNVFTAQTTVAAPAASLADAAMPEPTPVSPLATLGFTALVLALLSGAAVLATRRVRH